MPIDLSSLNISWLGWLVIAVAVLGLIVTVLRFFGHLLHILIRGCGVVLLVVIVLYVLRLLGII